MSSVDLQKILRISLVDLLYRTKQSIPFPLSAEDMYRSAFHPSTQLADAMTHRHNLRTYNIFLKPLPFNIYALSRQGSVVCYSMLSASEVQTQLHHPQPDVEFIDTKLLWVRHDEEVPIPKTSVLGKGPAFFVLGDPIRNDSRLLEWYAAVKKHDALLATCVGIVYQLAELFPRPRYVPYVFPELMRIVPAAFPDARDSSQTNQVQAKTIAFLRKRIDEAFGTEAVSKKQFIELITSATLLSPTARVKAWINEPHWGVDDV